MMSETALQELRREVRGPVLLPGESGFEQEIAAYNLATIHRPDVVAGVADAADVVAAMKWAAAHRVPVAVQATGHGADTVMEGGLLMATSRMQDFDFDPEKRVARVGAGVKWRKVIDAIVPHGLMGLNGSTTDVSVVGYTLGGGLPVMGRVFGFAADHVRSLDVVTPDGQLRRVDAGHEPDLFALLRGGKGNLGIVTSMTFDLFPLQDFYAGGIFYPGSDAEEVLTAFGRWALTVPDNVSTSVALLRLPELEFIPEPMRNQFLVHLRYCYVGDAEAGARTLAPMRAVSHPVADMVGPMTYQDIDQVHLDPPVPLPFLHAGEFLRGFDADVVGALLQQAGPGIDCPLLEIEIRLMGGAYAKASEVLDAVSGRDEPFHLVLVGLAASPDIDAISGSIKSIFKALAPYASGRTFVNMHGVPGDETDRARAWSPEVYTRLVQAKSRYDPDNLLRFQHAIGQPVVPA
ncbi:FAD-binding oxidoreductase [Arthrobacter sp. GCM10027362]|uniref:FAD-binding oxidoreductase n=1 Tax=Arthrobacter sp. GCM10027362 TaxID=3273379 RepID=UPI003624DF61